MTLSVRLFVIAFGCCAPLLFGGVTAAMETIRYAGETSLEQDFMTAAAQRFSDAHKVRFQLERSRSGAGIKTLAAGAIDLAGSGRFLTTKEKAAGLVEQLLGWDPLVVVVHVTNPVEDVSSENLRRLLLGNVRNWDQVGGRDLPILQVTAPHYSGIHEAVENFLRGDKDISPQAIVSMIVADADRNVAHLPAAFTVTSMSMVDHDQVKIIKVDGFLPNRQTVASGAYPLLNPLLLVTRGKPKGMLALFVNFAKSSEGQALIAMNYFPLTYK